MCGDLMYFNVIYAYFNMDIIDIYRYFMHTYILFVFFDLYSLLLLGK